MSSQPECQKCGAYIHSGPVICGKCSDWQDISTAPKDGTRVLLIDSIDRFPWIGSWNANLGDAGLWQEDGASLPDYQPEYWSPAPKLSIPPTEKD